MKTPPARRGPALSGTVRVATIGYGVVALVFGLVVGVAQLSFALHGCRTCWIALPFMLAVGAVGAACIRVGLRR
ncbi:MAG TPA: hypothetical protein VF166_03155 [Gemmatimonadaceae bacterium]